MGCNQSNEVSVAVSQFGDESKFAAPSPPDCATALRLAWYNSQLRDFEIITLDKLLARRKSESVVLGRSSQSDIQVSHTTVSGSHCKLLVEGDRLAVLNLSGKGTSLLSGNGHAETLHSQASLSVSSYTAEAKALPHAGAL